MEYKEQNNEENRNTPNLVSEDLIRFIRLRHFELVFVFVGYDGREILRYVFISCVRDQSLEIRAEHFVVEGFLERFDHSDGIFVHFYFDFVALHEFYRVEQRV